MKDTEPRVGDHVEYIQEDLQIGTGIITSLYWLRGNPRVALWSQREDYIIHVPTKRLRFIKHGHCTDIRVRRWMLGYAVSV